MFDSLLFGRHLEKDERLAFIVHKHWLIGLKDLFWPSVAFLLCWTVFALAPQRMIFYLMFFGSSASLVWWLRNFFDYYLDAWLITDKGIIDLEWKGWFHRQSSRILFSDIQGVSYEIVGVLGTLLRYGAVSVEKISTGKTIQLPYVPQPRSVEAMILQNMEQYLHTKNLKNAKHVQEILAEFVANEVNVRGVAPKVLPLREHQ